MAKRRFCRAFTLDLLQQLHGPERFRRNICSLGPSKARSDGNGDAFAASAGQAIT